MQTQGEHAQKQKPELRIKPETNAILCIMSSHVDLLYVRNNLVNFLDNAVKMLRFHFRGLESSINCATFTPTDD